MPKQKQGILSMTQGLRTKVKTPASRGGQERKIDQAYLHYVADVPAKSHGANELNEQ